MMGGGDSAPPTFRHLRASIHACLSARVSDIGEASRGQCRAASVARRLAASSRCSHPIQAPNTLARVRAPDGQLNTMTEVA